MPIMSCQDVVENKLSSLNSRRVFRFNNCMQGNSFLTVSIKKSLFLERSFKTSHYVIIFLQCYTSRWKRCKKCLYLRIVYRLLVRPYILNVVNGAGNENRIGTVILNISTWFKPAFKSMRIALMPRRHRCAEIQLCAMNITVGLCTKAEKM